MIDFHSILVASESGDFAPMNAATADASPCTKMAFSAIKRLAGLQREVDRDAILKLALVHPSDAAAVAVAATARYSWLDLDSDSLRVIEPALSQVHPPAETSAELRVVLERHRIEWAQHGTGALAAIEALEQRAASLGFASVAVEAAALRAAVLLEHGEVEEAIRHARRASRMGRTESLPQSEYWANLVLARVRRLTGKPYLAAMILRKLASIAPPVWSP